MADLSPRRRMSEFGRDVLRKMASTRKRSSARGYVPVMCGSRAVRPNTLEFATSEQPPCCSSKHVQDVEEASDGICRVYDHLISRRIHRPNTRPDAHPGVHFLQQCGVLRFLKFRDSDRAAHPSGADHTTPPIGIERLPEGQSDPKTRGGDRGVLWLRARYGKNPGVIFYLFPAARISQKKEMAIQKEETPW